LKNDLNPLPGGLVFSQAQSSKVERFIPDSDSKPAVMTKTFTAALKSHSFLSGAMIVTQAGKPLLENIRNGVSDAKPVLVSFPEPIL